MAEYDPAHQYLGMYRIRRFEERLAAIYPQGNMRLPVHFSIGQESTPVAVLSQFTRQDLCYASHRSHAPYLAKGGSALNLLRECYGLTSGCTNGIGGSMYLYDRDAGFGGSFAIVGDAVSVATGAAFAIKFGVQKTDAGAERVVVFIGDSVVETGQFWESLNFAALHQLPILYVCENNGYATQAPLHQRQPESIRRRVASWLPAGMYKLADDYNALPIVRFVKRWKGQEGPGYIEVATHRHVEHVGPNLDMDAEYRNPNEFKRHINPLDTARVAANISPQETAIIEAELDAIFEQAAQEAGSGVINPLRMPLRGHRMPAQRRRCPGR